MKVSGCMWADRDRDGGRKEEQDPVDISPVVSVCST